MNKLASLLIAGIFAIAFVPTLQAQPGQPGDDAGTPPDAPKAKVKPNLDEPVPQLQLDLARKMAEAGMQTMPAMLAERFNLTDAQKEAATKILQDRWKAMGADGQDKMFRAMILGRQLVESGQGTPEDFQKLAKEAQPAMEATMKMFNEAAADFEKVLDDQQKAKFNEDFAKFKGVQEVMTERFKQVASGDVKLEPNGEPPGGWPDDPRAPNMGRRGRNNDMQVTEEEVDEAGLDGVVRKVKVKVIKSKLPDEETVAGDEKYWTPFLKGYIAKFNLDDEQQKTARRLLGESAKRASDIRKNGKQAFDDARKRIKDAEAGNDPQAVERAHLAYDQLNRPVVLVFKDLERQLDNLLTAQQRESGKTRGELFGSPPGKGDGKDAPIDPKSDKTPPKPDPKDGDVKVNVIK